MHNLATTTPTDFALGMTKLPKTNHFNPPGRILKEIKEAQKIIQEKNEQIARMKKELDDQLEAGTITSKFSFEGISASLVQREGKWIYNDDTNLFAKELEQQLKKRLEKERQEGRALQHEGTRYWTIRNER